MAVNGAWAKARAAVTRIAAEAMQYDANGIDVYFLNSLLSREGIVVCKIKHRSWSKMSWRMML